MPESLPIHAETLRGQVMHDLGQLANTKQGPVTRRDAERLAAARAARVNVDAALAKRVAHEAWKDYRATERVKGFEGKSKIGSGYVGEAGPPAKIGVRVVLELTFPHGKSPFARPTASVLVNVAPGQSVDDAVKAAMDAWNARALQTPHGGESGGQATGGKIVQVVSGGFPQAQI